MIAKLMKYEFKGTYQRFAILFALLVLINVMFFTGIVEDGLGIFLLVNMSSLAAIAVFFMNLSSFRNDLYEDQGYLVRTLPIQGYQYVAAKLFTAIIWNSLVVLFIMASAYFTFERLQTSDGLLVSFIAKNDVILKFQIFSVVVGFIIMVQLLIYSYFAITITRVVKKQKRFGLIIGFIIFLILSGCIEWIVDKISRVFPYLWPIVENNNIFSTIGLTLTSGFFYIDHTGFGINIVGIITYVIIIGFLVFASGYLLDNKVDL